MRAKYILSEVMVGLWRNVTMTVAMIITMAVSLTMLGASLVMYKQVNDMKARFLSNVQVSIFLTLTVTPDQEQAIDARLKADRRVSGDPQFLDMQTSYNLFVQEMRNDPELIASVTPQQVPQSFRITLRDLTQFNRFVRDYKDLPGVDSVVEIP